MGMDRMLALGVEVRAAVARVRAVPVAARAICQATRWVGLKARRLERMEGGGSGVSLPIEVTGKRPPVSLTR